MVPSQISSKYCCGCEVSFGGYGWFGLSFHSLEHFIWSQKNPCMKVRLGLVLWEKMPKSVTDQNVLFML